MCALMFRNPEANASAGSLTASFFSMRILFATVALVALAAAAAAQTPPRLDAAARGRRGRPRPPPRPRPRRRPQGRRRRRARPGQRPRQRPHGARLRLRPAAPRRPRRARGARERGRRRAGAAWCTPPASSPGGLVRGPLAPSLTAVAALARAAEIVGEPLSPSLTSPLGSRGASRDPPARRCSGRCTATRWRRGWCTRRREREARHLARGCAWRGRWCCRRRTGSTCGRWWSTR